MMQNASAATPEKQIRLSSPFTKITNHEGRDNLKIKQKGRTQFLKKALFVWLVLVWNEGNTQSVKQLDQYIRSADSVQIAVHIVNSAGNTLYQHRSDEQQIAASIIKVPVLMALYTYFADENASLNLPTHILLEQEKVGGSGSLRLAQPGTPVTAFDLAKGMITQSDNTATNLLIDKIGMDTVNVWLRQNGYKKSMLKRKMMDLEAIKQGIQNETTAREICGMFLQMYNQARKGCRRAAAMLSILHECDDTTTMPAGLPPGIAVAHKTGLLDGMRCDAGIIFLEKPLIVSIFVKGCREASEAESIIAGLTGTIIEIFR